METISNPDYVYAAPAELKPQFMAVGVFSELKTHGLTPNMVVHYRELAKDGFIITAFTMSEKKLVKKVKKWFKVYPK